MKTRIYSIFGAAALSAVLFSGCQNSFDDPGLVVPEATLEANISIADLKKAAYNLDYTQLTPEKISELNAKTGSSLPERPVIKGRVISSDATGNIYQSLVIQDETGAMAFSIRRASLYNEYHLGQEIVVDTEGMWLGKFNYLIQLGWLGEYNRELTLSFMNFDYFDQHTQCDGLPDPQSKIVYGVDAPRPSDKSYCMVMDIDDLPVGGDAMYALQSQLVEFRNVSFDGAGELTYATYQENANRLISQKGNTLKLNVRNSGYASFYNVPLPEGTGTVRGILSWYGDPTYTSDDGSVVGWQLLIRSLDDVMFDPDGTQDDPLTVEEASEIAGQGRMGWVKGYIVGSVKAGVDEVKSNDDIIFGRDAEMNNNLVIASSADCKDYTRCMTVNLPAGSALRQYGNLEDNPGVYGKAIKVNGTFATFLGLPGVTNNNGDASEFEIDGVELDVPQVGGAGTETDPYTVPYVMQTSTDELDVWVEGYVVGYVDSPSKWDAAVFGTTPGTSSAWTNATNCILSAYSPDQASSVNSIPAGMTSLSVREILGISKNPDIYGKKVKVKGQITSNFGRRGLKNISEVFIVE